MNEYKWTVCDDPLRMWSAVRLPQVASRKRWFIWCHILGGLENADPFRPPETVTHQVVANHFGRIPTIPRPEACDIIREILGNPFGHCLRTYVDHANYPFPPPEIESWLDSNRGAARGLLSAVLTEKRWDILPALADAIEEAGCTDAAILAHLRGMEPCPWCHRRGKVVRPATSVRDLGRLMAMEKDLRILEAIAGKQSLLLNPDDWVSCDRCAATGVLPARHLEGCWAVDLLAGLAEKVEFVEFAPPDCTVGGVVKALKALGHENP